MNLKEYGSPKKVAASYGHTQYLIGPRLYPTFMLALQIVVFALVPGDKFYAFKAGN